MDRAPALRKILVVDDDPVIGRSFDRTLSGKGYAVITAKSGEEALRKLHAENYDVVFADILMPGISGIEVAKRLKASQPWLPVVIVTGYGSEENERCAREAGVRDFLRKPLSPEVITRATEMTLAAPATVEVAPQVAEAAPEPELKIEAVNARSKLLLVRDVALFFAAPFIGLVYLLSLPFVGLCALVWFGYKSFAGSVAKMFANLFRSKKDE